MALFLHTSDRNFNCYIGHRADHLYVLFLVFKHLFLYSSVYLFVCEGKHVPQHSCGDQRTNCLAFYRGSGVITRFISQACRAGALTHWAISQDSTCLFPAVLLVLFLKTCTHMDSNKSVSFPAILDLKSRARIIFLLANFLIHLLLLHNCLETVVPCK